MNHNRIQWAMLSIGLFMTAMLPNPTMAYQVEAGKVMLDDFEPYQAGTAPDKWKRPHKKSRSFLDIPKVYAQDDDFVSIVSSANNAANNNNALRIFTRDNSEQIALQFNDSHTWDLDMHPILHWKWLAQSLPENAREDKRSLNDSGAAVYVTFASFDWLNRPRTIKYVYSTSLPVGASATYGALKVLVVSSALGGLGTWITVQRNVVEDYQLLFGRKPPGDPAYLMLWGDSDNTKSISDVLFDDVAVSTQAIDR